MGIEIVKAAVASGRGLSGNAYKVLVTMALHALDKPKDGRPASLYWGGWDTLAVALGYDNADRGSAGRNAVARAVRDLRSARHITPMNDARRGFAQSYMVHPGGLSGGRKGEQNAHPKGEQNAHHRVSKTLTPRTHKDSRGLNEDIEITSQPQSQTAREEPSSKARSAHRFKGSPADECHACGGHYTDRSLHPLYLIHEETA